MKRSIVFWATYLTGYIYLAIQMTSAGEGTFIFLAPAMPFGVGVVLLLFAAYLFNKLQSHFVRICFALLIFAHYANSTFWIIYMWNDSFPGTVRIWQRGPQWIVITIVWYLLGQCYIWVTFSQAKHQIR